MNTTPGRSNVGVTFTPKPAFPVTLPTPVYVRGDVVGELIAYDSVTGHGTAALDNHMSAANLPFLSLMGYGYLGISLTPDGAGVHVSPDFRKVDAFIENFPERWSATEETLVAHVLDKMGNPPEGGKRQAIVARVRQWHTIQHSP